VLSELPDTSARTTCPNGAMVENLTFPQSKIIYRPSSCQRWSIPNFEIMLTSAASSHTQHVNEMIYTHGFLLKISNTPSLTNMKNTYTGGAMMLRARIGGAGGIRNVRPCRIRTFLDSTHGALGTKVPQLGPGTLPPVNGFGDEKLVVFCIRRTASVM